MEGSSKAKEETSNKMCIRDRLWTHATNTKRKVDSNIVGTVAARKYNNSGVTERLRIATYKRKTVETI